MESSSDPNGLSTILLGGLLHCNEKFDSAFKYDQTFPGDPLIVLEFMLLGDLRSFLRGQRVEREDEKIYVNSAVIESGLGSDDFLHIILDIAKGLEHLKSIGVRKTFCPSLECTCLVSFSINLTKGSSIVRCAMFLSKNCSAKSILNIFSWQIVHRDIAARNMLVDHNEGIQKKFIVKISDFGLAKKVDEDGVWHTSPEVSRSWIWVESLAYPPKAPIMKGFSCRWMKTKIR